LSIPNDEIRDQSFEVFTLSTAIQQTNKSDGSVRKGSAKLIEGLYLFTSSAQEKEEWIFFLQNLTSLPIHVDEKIEIEAKESMLESLPILKGETAKIDLEVRNYEVPLLQLQQRPHGLSLDEKEKEIMKISTPSPTRHNRKRVKHAINSMNSPSNNSHLSLDDDEGSDAESMASPLPKDTPDDQQQSLMGTLQKQFSFLSNIEHSSSSSPPPAENNNSTSPPASSSAPFLAALGKSASNYFYLSRSGGASSDEGVGTGGSGSVGLLTPVKRKSSGGGGEVVEQMEILESIDEEQKEDSEKKTSPREGKVEEKEENNNNNNEEEKKKMNETEVSFNVDSQEISPVKHIDEDEGKPPQHPQKHKNEEDDDFFQTITNASLRYETDESEDERDSSANKKNTRKDANNNNNVSTNSMGGGDQEKNQYKRMTFIAIQQQQQSLQKSSSNDPQSSSQQQQPQHSRSAYGGFSSYHSTTKESWIKHEKTSPPPNTAVGSSSLRRPPSVPVMTSYSTNATTQSSANSQFVGMVPVQSSMKPKQLIPVHDSSIPLAKRHSQMIKQCNKFLVSFTSQSSFLYIFLSSCSFFLFR
jgi:hypothetical protein